MKNIRYFLFAVILFCGLAATSFGQNKLTVAQKQQGYKLLFDGKSLNGWKNYNAPGITGWAVEDGCLAAGGTGADLNGYIITEKQYDNFDLTFDWKIAAQGNSGVLYHVLEGTKFKTPYLTGPEYQLIDEIGFPEPLKDWQLTGADYAMHLADITKKKLNPAGQWNTSRIVFDNGHVQHWLNGKKIIEFDAWTKDWFTLKNSGKWTMAPEYGLSGTGYISLQDHGSKVWFKNMIIKELPDKKKNQRVQLFNGKDINDWINYGKEQWYVDNGTIVCENGPEKGYGYLGTRDYYKNFDLTLKFMQETDGNSGVFFRSTCEGTTISGWQCEVAPMGNHTGSIYESYGRGWLIQNTPDKEKVLKKVGEWNDMRIKVVGNEVTTWLNGVQMIHLVDAKIGQANGRIVLQIHDNGGIKVRYKDLILTRL